MPRPITKTRPLISLDTETYGFDMYHGALPYFVTSCDEQDRVTYFEWDVDPFTRRPVVPRLDLQHLMEMLDGRYDLVLQNAKFDSQQIERLLIDNGVICPPASTLRWPWDHTYDTLLAGHLLASNQPHDLTSMALVYLGVNIQPLEDALEVACLEARKLVKQAWFIEKHGKWAIAKAGRPDMPSAKEKTWKSDGWLPRAYAKLMWESSESCRVYRKAKATDGKFKTAWVKAKGLDGWEWHPPEVCEEGAHSWWTVLSDYGNGDSAVTLPLFKRQRELMEQKGLWRIYLERCKLPRIVHDMERGGVVVNKRRLEVLETDYTQESERLGGLLHGIARSYDDYPLELPKGANNDSLRDFVVGAEIDGKSRCLVCRKRLTDRRRVALGDAAGDDERSSLSVCSKKCLKLYDPAIHPVRTVGMGLKSPKKTDKGLDSLDSKIAIPHWLATLPVPAQPLQDKMFGRRVSDDDGNVSFQPGIENPAPMLKYVRKDQRPWTFIKGLSIKRKRDTSLSYMRSYRHFWKCLGCPKSCIHCEGCTERADEWFVIHPSLNATGTDTLRWSSENPNEQQISKQSDEQGRNIRDCFGPGPGREWWSLDYSNLELRIPAYEVDETEMVAIFERPDDPPYFGSYHLLVFDILHPDKFAQYGKKCKDVFADTWYGWVKNGNFAIGYGSVEGSGTADRAYHVPGAFKQIKGRFKRIHGSGGLNERMISMANRLGYVETIPDKTVDPHRGYPIWCARTHSGHVLPTVPLNYHVQSTAMWVTMKAMIRVYAFLELISKSRKELAKWIGQVAYTLKDTVYRIVLQVHDELVVDFPFLPNRGNQLVADEVRRLMELSGNDISVPLKAGLKYHPVSWATIG